MKIDKSTLQHDLTTPQAFFLGCWYNMSHEQSLDGDRASFVNPINGIRELLVLYDFGTDYGGAVKRVTVGLELGEILSNNFVLENQRYDEVKFRLLHFFEGSGNSSEASQSRINSNSELIVSLLKELLELVESNYLSDAFEALNATIVAYSDDDRDEMFRKIINVTSSIIGALMSQGGSLQEASAFYRFILVRNVNTSTFNTRLERLRNAVLKPPELYELNFTIRSKALCELVGDVGEFFSFGLFKVERIDTVKLKAICEISAQSYTIAGTKAYDLLGELVDAVGYTLGKNEVIIETQYQSTEKSSNQTKTFKIHRPIPNPNYQFEKESFRSFCESVENKERNDLSGFVNKKIASAFRLLRVGVSAGSVEVKFTSYWTSLESLTRDVFVRENGDDSKVIAAALPCIAIDYINKRLKSFILAFHHIGVVNFTMEEGDDFSLQEVEPLDFFNILNEPEKVASILRQIEHFPLFQYKIKLFSAQCQSSIQLCNAIESHEVKVMRQLHRVYRARNLIVHDAGKIEGLESLCANLEHYLKSCLNTMTKLMAAKPTIKDPKECFIRYSDLVKEVKIELNPATKRTKSKEQRKKEEDKLVADGYDSKEKFMKLIELSQ